MRGTWCWKNPGLEGSEFVWRCNVSLSYFRWLFFFFFFVLTERSILPEPYITFSTIVHRNKDTWQSLITVSGFSAGFVLSWPGRRLRDVTSVRMWCLESPRWFWGKTRPSHTTLCLIWTRSRRPSTVPAQRSWSKAVSRATMPLCLHMDRQVFVLGVTPAALLLF